MRDFSWNYFSMTGDVESYLLFKQIDGRQDRTDDADDDAELDMEDEY